MKKIIMSAIALVVLAVVTIGIFVYVNADFLVKSAIERIGSQVAGVKVSVSSVILAIPEGKVRILGLTVANPAGFQSANAIQFGEITVSLPPGNATKNPLVIQHILVGAPDVTYELSQSGGSNIQALQQHVKASSSGGQTQEAKAAEPKDSKGDQAKLIIDALDVTNGKVTLASPIPGVAGTGALGDIHLTNIGRDSNGATGQQVAEQLLAAISKSAVNAAGSLGIGKQLDAVTKQGGDLGKAAGEGLKGLLGK